MYFDLTGNSAVDGKLKKRVEPDGTSVEYAYNGYGHVTGVVRRDNQSAVVSTETNVYTYFTGLRRIATQESWAKDAAGTALSHRLVGYSRDDRGTTNVWDDVVTLAFTRDWYGTNATEYVARRYTYSTGGLPVLVEALAGPGTNDYRVVASNAYNAAGQLVARTDAGTNTTWYAYDAANRLATETGWLTRGTPGTNDDVALVVRHSYDALNRLTELVYPDGLTQTWDYAVCGCGTASETDRGGDVTAFTYDHDKRVKTRTTTTAAGTVVSYVRYDYNPEGQVTRAYDLLSNYVENAYDDAGGLIESFDPLGRPTSTFYDAAGRTYMTVYADGTVSSNAYDNAGRLASVARYAPGVSQPLTINHFSYDALGRQVAVTDALGNTTTNVFDLLGRTVKTILPDGSYTETEYDLLGNATSVAQYAAPDGSTNHQPLTINHSSYDSLNRRIASIDPLGRTNTWEYDPDHPSQVKRVRDANGAVVQENVHDDFTGRVLTNTSYGVVMAFQYDALGQATNTLYPDGSAAAGVYDGPRLTRQVSRSGVTNSFGYDVVGRRIAVTNGLGQVTRTAYDAAGETVSVSDPLTNVTQFVYDSMGRQVQVIRPDRSVTTNAYDGLGRLVAKTGAGSVPAFYGYDALSRMTNLVDGEGNRTLFAYDALSRLVKKTYADGSFYQYGYNARGWLTNRVDALGRSTGYAYDNAGQLLKVDYPTDTDVLYAYDSLGRQTNRTDAAGTWNWTYDGESSRVLSESLFASSACFVVSYSYLSNTFDLASVSCGSSTTLYAWAAGRLTNVSSFGNDFFYSYVPNSDLLSQMSNQTFEITRTYDPASRLLALTNTWTGGGSAFSYTVDATGKRTQREDFSRTSGSWLLTSDYSYGYDHYDQLTSAARTNGPNGAADAAYRFAYQYDEVGNRLHEDRGQLDLDGSFNNLNQPTALRFGGKLDIVGTVSSTNPPVTVKVDGTTATLFNQTNYWGGGRVRPGSNTASIVAVDASSNRTETLRRYYLPPTNPQTFLWDLNGNLTNDGQRAFYWNEENKLVGIETWPGVPGVARKRSEFIFDAQSRMVQRKDMSGWTGAAYTTTNVTHYVRDGYRILTEMQVLQLSAGAGFSTQVACNVWGLDLSGSLSGAGGIGGLLCSLQSQMGDMQCRFYTFDGNGNVTDLINTNGSIIAHYEYDPFGRVVFQSGSCASSNVWQFSTKPFDAIWGLIHYEFRPYSPNLHIWLSRDSMEESAGIDVYCFIDNGPVDNQDLLGLTCFRISDCMPGETRDVHTNCKIKGVYTGRGFMIWTPPYTSFGNKINVDGKCFCSVKGSLYCDVETFPCVLWEFLCHGPCGALTLSEYYSWDTHGTKKPNQLIRGAHPAAVPLWSTQLDCTPNPMNNIGVAQCHVELGLRILDKGGACQQACKALTGQPVK